MNLEKYKIRNQKDIDSFEKVLLFGAGNYAKESVETFGKDRVLAIFDNDKNKWGNTIKDIPVLNPKENLKKYLNDKVAVVISTSSYQYDIAQELLYEYGVDRTHIFSLCSDYQEVRMYNTKDIFDNLDKINRVYELLGDKESKEYFYNSLKVRLTHDPLYLVGNPCMKGMYHYSVKEDNIEIKVNKNDCILDCGAFIGDTAQEFLKMTENTGKIYCFEPFEENYMKLEEWINEYDLEQNVKAYCLAVSDFEGVMNISADEEISTRANIRSSSKLNKQVKVECIDNLLNEFGQINFIKMDVEGEEINALNGAKTAITKYRPKMMISAYHMTKHLWEIPLLVHDICPEYKIYLGHNPKVPFEPEYYFI